MKNGYSTFSITDCIQNLQDAGFTPEQAQAREHERSRIDMMAILATKQDIEQLRSDTEKNIKGTEKEIIKYVGNQNLKAIGILGA